MEDNMIIKNINVFNTSQKKFEVFDVEIRDNIFWNIGSIDVNSSNQLESKIIDGSGKYLIPGLIDIHMHIESSMTTPAEYSNVVLKKGVTTIVADAHEVANAQGLEGLMEYMKTNPKMDIFYSIPSSVPSTNPNLETTKGIFTEREIEILCNHPKIIALGEIMNFKDIVSLEDTPTKRIISEFRKNLPNAPIEGHIPRVTGLELARYAHSGIGSDHTHQSVESLLEKTRLGFQIQLQEKSMTKEIFEAIKEFNLEESICFVTDDVIPDDIFSKGTLDHLIRKSTKLGFPMEDAIYSSTHIPAKRMNLFDRGIIAPGKIADAVILSNLENFEIEEVIKSGKLVSELDEDKIPIYSKDTLNSIKRDKVKKEDFSVETFGEKALVRVIEREETTTFTKESFEEVEVKDGKLLWKEKGLNLICAVERYGNDAPLKFGFVKNGFSKPCAIASSWAHDSHNILVMGNCEILLAEAVNQIIENQGGMYITTPKISQNLPMEFGGVVSIEPLKIVAEKISNIRKLMKDSGYISHNEIMSFSTLALLVTPELKISDKGYIRVRTQEILDWRVK